MLLIQARATHLTLRLLASGPHLPDVPQPRRRWGWGGWWVSAHDVLDPPSAAVRWWQGQLLLYAAVTAPPPYTLTSRGSASSGPSGRS